MNKKLSRVALCIAAATTVAPALAAESSGWYAGLGFGQSTNNDWMSKDDALDVLDAFGNGLGIYAFSGTVDSSSDDKDTGWKIYGGYQFTPNFALEASYLDLGEATAKSSATGAFASNSLGVFGGTVYTKVTGEATAITLDAVGTINPTPWLGLFAKVGVYRAELELTLKGGIATASGGSAASESIDDDATNVHVALGADFNVAQNVTVRAEWERLSKADFEDGQADLDMLSLSAIYHF